MTDIFATIVDLQRQGRTAVLVTVVAKQGHVPLDPPARMLVDAGGRVAGTVGGGAIENHALADAQSVLTGGEPCLREYLLDEDRPGSHDVATGMLCGGKVTLFYERLAPARRAYLFGAGHIGQALAPLLPPLGIVPVLVDCRPEYLAGRSEPCLQAGPDYTTLPDLPALNESAVVIATHGHVGDQRVLAAVLGSGARPWYLGLIASTRKWRVMARALRDELGDAALLQGVRAPAGLRLGGRSPAAIALAVAAEMQAALTGEGEHDHLGIDPFTKES
ncbi:MAG: XdhC family protein [Candidatus Krumholzibacteriia bacterium]